MWIIGVGPTFHMNCFIWINSVPVQVDIRWISCEECQPFLFHMFSTCIFYMDYWCIHHLSVVYLVDNKVKFEPYFFQRVIHVAFLMWIIAVHFQVYST